MSAPAIKTVTTYLRPIDQDGLAAFAEKGRSNPGARGTNKVHTVVDARGPDRIDPEHVVTPGVFVDRVVALPESGGQA